MPWEKSPDDSFAVRCAFVVVEEKAYRRARTLKRSIAGSADTRGAAHRHRSGPCRLPVVGSGLFDSGARDTYPPTPDRRTEGISKGKTGVPVVLGLGVAIGEDQHGFILHHLVMERITDDQVAVPWWRRPWRAFLRSPARAWTSAREGDPRLIQLRR